MSYRLRLFDSEPFEGWLVVFSSSMTFNWAGDIDAPTKMFVPSYYRLVS